MFFNVGNHPLVQNSGLLQGLKEKIIKRKFQATDQVEKELNKFITLSIYLNINIMANDSISHIQLVGIPNALDIIPSIHSIELLYKGGEILHPLTIAL